MKREHERDDVIDLGAVTEETKGPTVGLDDHANGRIFFAGLSDE